LQAGIEIFLIVIAADAHPALAKICHLHAASRDEPAARWHGDATQHTPLFEGIDNEGAGLRALPCAALLFFFEPSGSLFFGFGSLALPLAALVDSH
jgi:hypothetical protein